MTDNYWVLAVAILGGSTLDADTAWEMFDTGKVKQPDRYPGGRPLKLSRKDFHEVQKLRKRKVTWRELAERYNMSRPGIARCFNKCFDVYI